MGNAHAHGSCQESGRELHAVAAGLEPPELERDEQLLMRAAEQPEQQMGLGSLPDLPLLEVFAKLPPAQLLECRAVCRRWRALAMDSRAWRDCRVSYDAKADPKELVVLRTTLRLAPCLRELTVNQLPPPISQLLTTTQCRIDGLVLNDMINDSSANTFISALENQAARGGLLRNVRLVIQIFRGVESYVRVMKLMCTVRCEDLYITDLSGRDISLAQLRALLPRAAVPTKPSLKKLIYLHSLCHDGLFEFLLLKHRYTLKHLEILRIKIQRPPQPLEALAGLESLERLSCHLVPNMDRALLACRRLVDLTLSLHPYDVSIEEWNQLLQAGRSFLRDAVALKRLRLISYIGVWQFAGPEVDLMCSAASSGQSQLQEVYMESTYDLCNVSWEELLRALPGLPRLRVLSLHFKYNLAPPLSFLMGLSAQVAPAMRNLRADAHLDCLGAKPQDQVSGLPGVTVLEYVSELRQLLRRVPALHITGLKCYSSTACQCCSSGAGCWGKLLQITKSLGVNRSSKGMMVGLYAHDETEECEHHEWSEYVDAWVRVV